PAPWGHPGRRAVRPGPAVPAPPRLELHRRRAPRRRLRHRPHRRAAASAAGTQPGRGGGMSEQTTRHDVVVVGARAAGAATAMLLAGAGLDVLVVDRSRYGADTLSTHALMRAGVAQLHRWGLLDAVVRAGTPPVRATTF